MSYEWRQIQLDDFRFLSPLRPLFSTAVVEAWTDSSPPIELSRTHLDGLITLRGWLNGKRVGVVQCDFRVNGGSFGHENSQRLVSFLTQMQNAGAPVIMMLNTLGVRIMEGRTVFGDAFSIWPALTRFRQSNLLITCAQGKCLGLGALFFGMGHYRMAVQGDTHINLTGPEVLRLFFGEKYSFENFAAAETHFQYTDLVHEIMPDRASVIERAKLLASLTNPAFLLPAGTPPPSRIPGPPQNHEAIQLKMDSILNQIHADRFELFPDVSPIVKIFVTQRDGQKLGVFINPPGNANNMITIEALQKYASGIDLFKALGIPMMSFLDSPGADPRVEQSNRGNIRTMLSLGDKIIFYPYGTMGVITGRCYGGASTLAFPKVFGGLKTLMLKGGQAGVIHSSIIRSLFSNAPRLLESWEKVLASETADVADLIRAGVIDHYIEENELGAQVSEFIAQLKKDGVLRHVLRLSDRRERRHPAQAPAQCRRTEQERRAVARIA